MKQKMKDQRLLKLGAMLCLLALWAFVPFMLNDTVEADSMSDTRIQASLSGAAIGGVTPAGFSEYRIDDDGRRRLNVQASSVNLPAGTVLDVSVNNAVVRQMTVNAFSGASFDIDTNNGQNVPAINNGNSIQVANAGTVILSGSFGIVVPTPSPSGSPTGSPTGSPSGSPSPSPTGSPTGSPSPSPTGSPTGSPSPSPGGTPNAGNLFAGLSGVTINGVLPGGYAEYELHSSRIELEIRIRQVSLPAGTALAVVVNDTAAGTLVLESGGEGRLRLRSDRGDNIPVVVNGSTIRISNGGSAILSGTFTGFTGPTPSPSPSPTVSPSPGGTPSPGPSPSPSPSPGLGRAFEANLTGVQLDPPVATNATGEFKVTLNGTETQATIFGEFHNLSSAQTGARIESTVGDGTLIHSFGAIGGTNGNFASVTIDVNAAQVQQFRTGLVRAVITSANNPGGEIGAMFRQQSNRSDFDGDGGNDFAVFRPSNGIWYVQNDSGFSMQAFGDASDKVVSSDFDGDGKTDWAVYKNVNGLGVWETKRSSDGGVTSVQFGLATDDPVRGDFDGDGRIDVAVYRQSNGVWYVKQSGNGAFNFVQFGLEGDRAIPADMDGDGKDDMVVFRPSNGNWYWINSSTGQHSAVHWGKDGDIPVVADIDGDGKNDITIFRPAEGSWYSTLSSTGAFFGINFGLFGDIPVAGDYDHDGKTDVAVYRQSDGMWYIMRSRDGVFQTMRFGLSEDIPAIAH